MEMQRPFISLQVQDGIDWLDEDAILAAGGFVDLRGLRLVAGLVAGLWQGYGRVMAGLVAGWWQVSGREAKLPYSVGPLVVM